MFSAGAMAQIISLVQEQLAFNQALFAWMAFARNSSSRLLLPSFTVLLSHVTADSSHGVLAEAGV